MKIRILPLVAIALIAAGTFFTSCLSNDYEEVELPSVSSIKSFSLGTLYQTLYKGGSKGQDTIDTVSYAKYPFVIDQINRRIYNVDSLPKGVDITKALVKISSDTEMTYYNYETDKKENDTLWTPTDTLDLTKGLILKVLTYSPTYNDFRFGKPYTVTVNVHKYNPDSLVWKHFDSNTFNSLSEQKAVYADKHIYVFGKENNDTKVYKLSVNKGNVESNWETVTPANANSINIHSALAFNNDVYYVSGGQLFCMNGNGLPMGNNANLACLVSATNDSIMAYTTENTVISLDKDGNAGTKTSASEYNFSGRFSAVSYRASHNDKLWRTLIMSNNTTAEADTTANVFSHISSDKEFIKNTPNNPATCPNLENISMIRYDGKLYAFGGKHGDKIKPFEHFYYSINNGFDWEKEENKYMKFDTDAEGNNLLALRYGDKPYSCVVETNNVNGENLGNDGRESFIWFVWHDGKISRAHLNKYAPKN